MTTAGVEFDQDQYSTTVKRTNEAHFSQQNSGEKGIAGWLMKHGIAKSPKMAQFIQIGIIVINLAITFWFLATVF